jgi:transposase
MCAEEWTFHHSSFSPISFLSSSMPARFSTDLRWRVVWCNIYFEASLSSLSSTFFVSQRTIFRILQQFRLYGTVSPPTFLSGREQSLSGTDLDALCDILTLLPTVFLREISNLLSEWLGRRIPLSTICHTLHRHGITHRRVRACSLSSFTFLLILFFSNENRWSALQEIAACSAGLNSFKTGFSFIPVNLFSLMKQELYDPFFFVPPPVSSSTYCRTKGEQKGDRVGLLLDFACSFQMCTSNEDHG